METSASSMMKKVRLVALAVLLPVGIGCVGGAPNKPSADAGGTGGVAARVVALGRPVLEERHQAVLAEPQASSVVPVEPQRCRVPLEAEERLGQGPAPQEGHRARALAEEGPQEQSEEPAGKPDTVDSGEQLAQRAEAELVRPTTWRQAPHCSPPPPHYSRPAHWQCRQFQNASTDLDIAFRIYRRTRRRLQRQKVHKRPLVNERLGLVHYGHDDFTCRYDFLARDHRRRRQSGSSEHQPPGSGSLQSSALTALRAQSRGPISRTSKGTGTQISSCFRPQVAQIPLRSTPAHLQVF